MKNIAKKVGVGGALFALTAVCCFAQETSTFGIAAHRIMNEVVAVVKYIGVIILVVAGLSLAVPGGVRVFERMSSTVMGLLIAVEAVSLMAWLTT